MCHGHDLETHIEGDMPRPRWPVSNAMGRGNEYACRIGRAVRAVIRPPWRIHRRHSAATGRPMETHIEGDMPRQ
jgi:hypothetical protein